MLAQDYERGRFAICDSFASSRSTGVVYEVADPGVTGLLTCSRGLPICDRATAQRDVMPARCRLHAVTSFRSSGSGGRGADAGAVVPAGGGQAGQPGGLGDGQPDRGDAPEGGIS
jgi:hypothetical protein